MRTAAAVLLCCLVTVACSSSDGDGSSSGQPTKVATAACVSKGASYIVRFQSRGGDCGPIDDQVINTGTDGTVSTTSPSACTGEFRNEGCDVILTDYECPTPNGGRLKQTGKITWAADGSKASGTVQYQASFQGESCTGTYLITYTRQ